MSEPKGCAGACLRIDTDHVCYRDRCDLFVGLPGLRVIEVHAERPRLVVPWSRPGPRRGADRAE
ncbi:MAG TPA: hypothetical protein VF635_10640 [Propionibacteriaceae bacterium]|jgi:hypothetical protein